MSSSSEKSPHPKPWEEMNPILPGIMAFLIPGTGHLIQGRYFKGLIYLVCIHGAFFTGMCLGEGMTVHNKPVANAQGWRKISLSYAAQFPVGIWALPALIQPQRVESQFAGVRNQLEKDKSEIPTESSFRGVIEAAGSGSVDYQGPLVGTIRLDTQDAVMLNRDVHGEFIGTLNGEPFERKLSGGFAIDKPIGASPRRELRIRMERSSEDHPNLDLMLQGSIPRPLWNWYEVPPDTDQLKAITGRLGKYYELALVFTWIAGLLNILVIWDCVKGPSLGFGDETPADGKSSSSGGAAPAELVGKPAGN
ncbi:MAG: DUF6677 family protein [Planctomycetaceae bacterium]